MTNQRERELALDDLAKAAALVDDSVLDEAAMQMTRLIIRVFGGLCESPLLRDHLTAAQADVELLDETIATFKSAERSLVDQEDCGSSECLRTFRRVSDALLPIVDFMDRRSLWGQANMSESASPLHYRQGGAIGRVEEALHKVTGLRPFFLLNDYLRLRGAL